jgi:hypothetical protein
MIGKIFSAFSALRDVRNAGMQHCATNVMHIIFWQESTALNNALKVARL